jgi:hypothetical protein
MIYAPTNSRRRKAAILRQDYLRWANKLDNEYAAVKRPKIKEPKMKIGKRRLARIKKAVKAVKRG